MSVGQLVGYDRLHDVLGSVVALANSAGQVVERYDYDPYGTTTIMDAAALPLALKPVDPAAADGYYHDHDRDGDIDAADYTDLMDCVNNTPYDPMCIYTHDRTGDRRVDIVDVGVYLAYADDQGLAGGTSAPELVHYGRPLRLQFDADGDGRVDMFDWYAMQTCFTKNTTRCKYLFDDNGDGVVNFYDLTNFKTAADGPQGGPGATQWRRKLVASRYGNPFMWTGQRYDATTGQYHFWARTYSPRLGRWMQRDPLEYIDGLTLYGSLANNPTAFVDPYGLYIDRDVVRNPDGTITWHIYDRGITGLFRNEYLGSITFDPNDTEAAWQAKYLYERAYNFRGAARDIGTGLKVAIIIASAALPGPEDAILVVLGLAVKGGKLYKGGKLLKGDELAKAQKEIKALRELWSRLRRLPSHIIQKLKDAGIDIHDLKRDLLGRDAELKLFDLFYDPDTGRIYLRRKNGTGEPIDTGLLMDEFCDL
jgi:RHS repeat-associated protein